MTDPFDEKQTEEPSQVPIMSNNDSGSKRSRKNKASGLEDLLEEASRYSPRYASELPRGFLRDKSSKKEQVRTDDDDNDIEGSRVQMSVLKKKSRVGRPRKINSNYQNGVSKSVSSSETSSRNGEELGGLRKKWKVGRPRKKDTDHHQDGTVSLPCTVASSQNNEACPAETTAYLDDSRVRNQEKQNGVESTFVNWKANDNDVRSDLIDLDYVKSHTHFDGDPTPSTVLTAKRREKSTEVITVKLQSLLFDNYREEYDICFTKDLNIYNPMSEIGKIIEYMVTIFLPSGYATRVQNEVLPSMNQAFDEGDTHAFAQLVDKYSEIVTLVTRQETFDHLAALKSIPSVFIHDFLHTVYTRSIFPQYRRLRQYEAFSSYVYGELLPGFLTEAFARCQLGPNQIFMDLGSGVGNCVVQAALECGCGLSFGCEIMANASDLAEAQFRELVQRCKLFGLKLPPIEYSLRQSFVGNKRVDELIPQCDVLLINNFLFDSKMNLQVEKLIQNAKVGCKIITLRNLRASGYTINFFNLDSILNRLHVERFELKEDSVSWTHSGGEYYISTVMETMDESLFDPSLRQRRTRRPTRYTR